MVASNEKLESRRKIGKHTMELQMVPNDQIYVRDVHGEVKLVIKHTDNGIIVEDKYANVLIPE